MNSWVNRFNKARREADAIEKGETLQGQQVKRIAEEAERPLVKRYTLYSQLNGVDRAIAFGLYSGEIERIETLARMRLIKAAGGIVEGDPLFKATTFVAREEI